MTDAPPPDQPFRAWVTPQGVVWLRWTPSLRITGTLAAAAMTAVDRLNEERPRPLLVQMTGVATPTREARDCFGHRCTATRIALLGRTVVDRIHASYAPRYPHTGFPVPTTFFTSEAAALAWLHDLTPPDLTPPDNTPPDLTPPVR